MHKYLMIPVALFTLAACQQSPKSAGSADSTVAQAITDTLAPTWAKRFTGTIARQPVTLLLQKNGTAATDLRGWYAYDHHGEPISLRPFYGENRTDDSIIVNEGYTGEDGVIRGIVSADGHFKGKWINADNTFDFDLKENNDSAVSFSVVTFSDSAKLLPGNAQSPVATASAYTVWPTGGAAEPVITFLRQALAPGLKAGETPATLLKNGADSFFASYKSNAASIDSASMNGGPSWQWSAESGSVVTWNKWPYLVIEDWVYDFTGGAHGNGGSLFSVYDLSQSKKLTPADVFKPGYKPVVTAALEKSYRKKYKVPANQTLTDAGLQVKKIEPGDNFFLTSHGVGFSYTPYEIAAYAAGQITLFVPWADIKTVVREEYLR